MTQRTHFGGGQQKTCRFCNTTFTAGSNRAIQCETCRTAKASETTTRTCITCGDTWQTRRKDARFCSDACKGDDYRRTRRKTQALVVTSGGHCSLPPTPPTPEPIEYRIRIWYAGACAWCEEKFVSNQPLTQHCSLRCAKSAYRARRGFAVKPKRRRALYERDDWTCQLCLDPVDSSLHTSDPWAATLDHIECQSWTDEPDHSDDNLRLAHRWCNSVRGDGSRYSLADLRVS